MVWHFLRNKLGFVGDPLVDFMSTHSWRWYPIHIPQKMFWYTLGWLLRFKRPGLFTCIQDACHGRRLLFGAGFLFMLGFASFESVTGYYLMDMLRNLYSKTISAGGFKHFPLAPKSMGMFLCSGELCFFSLGSLVVIPCFMSGSSQSG